MFHLPCLPLTQSSWLFPKHKQWSSKRRNLLAQDCFLESFIKRTPSLTTVLSATLPLSAIVATSLSTTAFIHFKEAEIWRNPPGFPYWTFHDDITRHITRLRRRLKTRLVMADETGHCQQQRIGEMPNVFDNGLFFACTFEENRQRRQASVVAADCDETIVRLVASAKRVDYFSTFVMRRYGPKSSHFPIKKLETLCFIPRFKAWRSKKVQSK